MIGPFLRIVLPRHRRQRRASFTLIELLMVMAIIAVISSSVLVSLFGVMEDAKGNRTKSQIMRINELLMTKWENYRTRPVPFRISAGTQPRSAAWIC